MNILITGASGFIGQQLVVKLLEEGIFTIRGTCQQAPEFKFFDFKKIDWRTIDLAEFNSFCGICDGIDVVVHCAAIARQEADKSWDDYQCINVDATKQLLEEAEKSGVKRFVYLSTVEAAGFGNGIDPRTEEDTPAPFNYYGKSKLEAENILHNNTSSVETVILRLPMIYGPGNVLVIPKLFGMVAKGFYPFIGSGSTLMEFCYVGNVVNAILLAISHENASNDTFYVSDSRSYSIREVIFAISKAENRKIISINIPIFLANMLAVMWEIIAKIAPIPPIISKISRKPFFSRETVWWTTRNVNIVSTDKIKSKLGYSATFSIDQGCSEMVTWLKKENLIQN